MFNELEIENISNLLLSAEPANLQLGLVFVENNLEQIDAWMGILQALRLASRGEKSNILGDWFDAHKEIPVIQEAMRRVANQNHFQFFRWASRGRHELDEKKKRFSEYETFKDDFLTQLEFYKKIIFHSDRFYHINDALSVHFCYSENDYFLATEFSLLLIRKDGGIESSYWNFFKFLIYFHFPNHRLLAWKPRLLAWIDNLLDTSSNSYNNFYFTWIKGKMYTAFDDFQNAKNIFLAQANWVKNNPNSNFEQGLLNSIYGELSVLFAREKNLSVANKYLKLALKDNSYKYPVAQAKILVLQDKRQEAIELLEKFVHARPITESYWEMLAELALEQNHADKAIEYYAQSVKYSPQYRKHFVALLKLLEISEYPDKQALIQKYTEQLQHLDAQFDKLEKLASF